MKNFQKFISTVSIVFFISLLVALFFSPASSRTPSIVIIGSVIILTIYCNWETKQNDELTTAQFTRNIAVDLLGLALTMSAAIWLGRMAGGYAGQAWGIIAGIVAGMAVGFGAALVVGQVWGRVSDRFRASAML